MTQSPLKRTYYFQGELLGVPDFVRDQQYLRDLVATQNAAVFTAGAVGAGLTVGANHTQITVSAGFAFDGLGRPLIVPSSGVKLDAKNPVLPAGTYYVGLQYADTLANGDSGQLELSHEITELPVVVAQTAKPTDTSIVVLGMVDIDGSGGVSNPSAQNRQTAALTLATSGGGESLAAGGEERVAAVASPPGPPAPPAPPPPAAASLVAGPMAIGDPYTGLGAPEAALLTVALDVTKHTGQSAPTAVASFGFQNGPSSGGMVSIGHALGSSDVDLLYLTYDNQRVWCVDQDGAVFATSDARAKRDIQPLTGPLEALKKIQGVSYTSREGGRRRMGVLAQDVEAVFPEAVRTDPEGRKALVYEELIGVLVEAVKELTARVEVLERAAAKPPRRSGKP